MGCLDPPLDEIPEQNWFCPNCVSGHSGAHAHPEVLDPHTHEHRDGIGGAGIKEAALRAPGWQGYDGACGFEPALPPRLDPRVSATAAAVSVEDEDFRSRQEAVQVLSSVKVAPDGTTAAWGAAAWLSVLHGLVMELCGSSILEKRFEDLKDEAYEATKVSTVDRRLGKPLHERVRNVRRKINSSQGRWNGVVWELDGDEEGEGEGDGQGLEVDGSESEGEDEQSGAAKVHSAMAKQQKAAEAAKSAAAEARAAEAEAAAAIADNSDTEDEDAPPPAPPNAMDGSGTPHRSVSPGLGGAAADERESVSPSGGEPGGVAKEGSPGTEGPGKPAPPKPPIDSEEARKVREGTHY